LQCAFDSIVDDDADDARGQERDKVETMSEATRLARLGVSASRLWFVVYIWHCGVYSAVDCGYLYLILIYVTVSSQDAAFWCDVICSCWTEQQAL
jgi:hypothetical protein